MTATDHDDGHQGLSHVMPLKLLFTIFAILIVLTMLTVYVGQLDLGSWEIVITMLIATIKASLVAIYFMHLRYDSPFNATIFVFSLLFVALFIGFTLVDVQRYQPDLLPPAGNGVAVSTETES
jgi:cytochrome c oxidase subunit 4